MRSCFKKYKNKKFKRFLGVTHLLWSPSELPLGVFTETALLYPPPGGKLALFSRSLALALVLRGGVSPILLEMYPGEPKIRG